MMRSPVGCGQGVRAHEDESDGDAAGAFGAVERRTSGEATWKERRCVGVERGSYTQDTYMPAADDQIEAVHCTVLTYRRSKQPH